MSKKKLKGISPKIGNKIGDIVIKERVAMQIYKLVNLKEELSNLNKNRGDLSVNLEIQSLKTAISYKIMKLYLIIHLIDKLYLKEKDNRIKYPRYKHAKRYLKHLDKDLKDIKNKVERIKNDR